MMEIKERKDAVFWREVQSDREVSDAFSSNGVSVDLAHTVSSPFIRTFTSTNGGYFAVEMLPGSGRYWDLHAAFTSKRNAREAYTVAAHMVETLFNQGAVLLQMSQRIDHLGFKPPASFGWCAVSDRERMRSRQYDAISWILTRKMWYASITYKRLAKK